MSPAVLHIVDLVFRSSWLWLLAVYVPLCTGIVLACIFRIRLMTARSNKLGWNIMYTLMTCYAGGELLDVLTTGHWMATHELAGLVAIALNLRLTQRSWNAGPPAVTCKESTP
jgi:hypothetical protein